MARKSNPDRKDDEAMLRDLALIVDLGPGRAAPLIGVTAPYASVLRQRVMGDDIRASVPHESEADIRAAYGVGRAR